MTVINFKIDDDKKKEIEKITKIKGFKSISEFIRQLIDKEMNLQKKISDFVEANPPLDRDKINIPDYIPDGKYLGIARNAIVAIGDNAQEVAKILAEKFSDSASGIIQKGHENDTLDCMFSIFSIDESNCYHQYNYKGNYYPLLPFSLHINKNKENFIGLIDTGATISALDKKIIEEFDLKSYKTKELYTINGISKVPVYKAVFGYNNKNLELDFIGTEITKAFSFHSLLGKNFIDNFNILLLGQYKLFFIQPIF